MPGVVGHKDLMRLMPFGFVERFNPVIGAAMDVLTGPPVHLVALRHSPPAPRIAVSVVADMLIHDLDLAVGFADLAEVDSLASNLWTPPGSAVPDIADCTIRFAGGMLATLSASRRSQRPLCPRGAVAFAMTTAGLSRPARVAGINAAMATTSRAPPRATRSRAGEKDAW